jgi:predicted RNase H-like HicB family nuclease
MEKNEYPAMIYRKQRNNVFVANCIMKNSVGFGKTEEDALESLKKVLKKAHQEEIILTPVYGFMGL